MTGRPRRTTQNPRYTAPFDNYHEEPPLQPPPPPHANYQGLRQEDLVAIATMVAQAITQTQNQQQAQAPPELPATLGTKTHYEALRRAHVPTFDGTHDPEVVQAWLKQMEDNFELMEVPIEIRPRVVVPFLVGEAAKWWEGVSPVMLTEGPITWAQFREAYLRHYFPNSIRLQKMAEFDNLTQTPGMSVVEYSSRFHTLGKYSPTIMSDPQLKIPKFIRGLRSRIQSALAVYDARSFDELLGAAIRAEADIKRRDEENNLKRPRLGPGPGKGVPTKRPSHTPQTQGKSAFPARPPLSYPLCGFCHRYHLGECRRKIGACFRCGQAGHKVSECPQPDPRVNALVPRPLNPTPSQRSKGNPAKGNARVFAMTQAEAANAEDVVTGTITVDNLQAYALFDCGATHSFISKKFAKHLNRARVSLDEPYRVTTLGNTVLVTNVVYPNCEISLDSYKLKANLIQINMREFDVILGMDWLVCSFAHVDCRGKIVNFHPPNGEGFFFQGGTKGQPRKTCTILSAARAVRAIKKGCEALLAFTLTIE
ncbi:UNVERIFIED_CONTAM: hypothetical protein Sradi_1880500 [Sesamum radiatum]|uniref:CCHC-type domain-containing protein n=1 Tax=Sesamum radiatum TaxID=300843 RepID=A0AAW2TWS5_SESRA